MINLQNLSNFNFNFHIVGGKSMCETVNPYGYRKFSMWEDARDPIKRQAQTNKDSAFISCGIIYKNIPKYSHY